MVLSWLLPLSAVVQAAPQPPNIVFIMLDDLGNRDFFDFAVDGSTSPAPPTICTPGIDTLIRAGTRFTSYYVEPVCSPTRIRLTTGRSPAAFNVRTGLNSLTDRQGIPEAVETLPEALQSHGYRTGSFGKWHQGLFLEEFEPPAVGFDVAEVRFGGYCDPDFVRYTSTSTTGPTQETGLLTELIFDKTETFIAADDDPFFVNIWPFAGHVSDPMNNTTPYSDAVDCTPHFPTDLHPDTPGSHYYSGSGCTTEPYCGIGAFTRDYFALVSYADRQVLEFLHWLDDEELLDNTWIFISSDNGAVGVDPALPKANSPYDGTKGSLFEGAIRVPLVAAWGGDLLLPLLPGSCTAEPDPMGVTAHDGIISASDVYPTLVELASGSAPGEEAGLEGQSFAWLLEGGSDPGTVPLPLAWERAPSCAYWEEPNHSWREFAIQGTVAGQTGQWKLIFDPDCGTTPSPTCSLFDLASSVTEGSMDDLYDSSKAGVVTALYDDYLAWRARTTRLPLEPSQVLGEIDVAGRDLLLRTTPSIDDHLVRLEASPLHDVYDGDFSFTALVRPAQASRSHDALIAEKAGTWQLWLQTDDTVRLDVWRGETCGGMGDPCKWSAFSDDTLSASSWHRVTFAIVGRMVGNTAIRLYVDDDIQAIGPVEGGQPTAVSYDDVQIPASNSTSRILLGGNFAKTWDFEGSIYDVDFRVSALNKDEIERLPVPLFFDSLESGSYSGTQIVDASSIVTIDQSSALVGEYGASLTTASSGPKAWFLDETPAAEEGYRASLSFDADGATIDSGQNQRLLVTTDDTASALVYIVQLRENGGKQIQLLAADGAGWTATSWLDLDSGLQQVEVDYRTDGSDAALELRLNGETVAVLEGISSGRVVDRTRFGLVDVGVTSGTLKVDHFKSYRLPDDPDHICSF